MSVIIRYPNPHDTCSQSKQYQGHQVTKYENLRFRPIIPLATAPIKIKINAFLTNFLFQIHSPLEGINMHTFYVNFI